MDCLHEGEYFIPRQVGLPEKRFDDGWTDADHCWFELSEDSFESTADTPTIALQASDLVEAFVAQKNRWDDSISGPADHAPPPMDLHNFLAHFDFDYDIVLPGGEYEDRIRQELIEDGNLSAADISQPLICLIDLQGAYFGDIGKMRYPIDPSSVSKIIDRMDIYIQDSVIDEFATALSERGIDPSSLSLGDMVSQCQTLGVGDGEVCYPLAEAINYPESIFIKEVLEPEKNPLVLDFGNIVSELETKKLKLLKIKDNNSLFVVDCVGNLYDIDPYYAGGSLDRFIGEKFVISFERMEQPTRNFEDWRKEFMDASWIKSFIERVVKKEYPNFTQACKPLTAQIQEAEARSVATYSGETPAKNISSHTR